jgi:hypothetical protein
MGRVARKSTSEEPETDQEQPLLLTRPPKKVSEMSEAELDAWADQVIEAVARSRALRGDLRAARTASPAGVGRHGRRSRRRSPSQASNAE